MDDFDGAVITEDSVAGFFAGYDGRDTADFDRKVKEAAYIAEIEEIETLTEALLLGRLRKTDLSPKARKKGLAILKARCELVESLYDGRSIDEIREVEFAKKERAYEVAMGEPITLRVKAKIRGLETYRADAPCRNGHVNPVRSTSHDQCIKCRQARYERLQKKAQASPQS